MKVPVFLYPPKIEEVVFPEGTPFGIPRVQRTREIAESLGLLDGLRGRELPSRLASREELLAYHSASYLDEIDRAAAGQLTDTGRKMGLGTPDTPVYPRLSTWGALSGGAALDGAQLILDGEADRIFTPFGGSHHAYSDRASGFCYINGLVLACMKLAEAGKTVVCLDIDGHHGDGTQDAFYYRDDVATISMHESGAFMFPGTGFEDEVGRGTGEGFCANLPLPMDTYDEAWLYGFREVVLPLLDVYEPDVLVMQAGVNTLATDAMTNLKLTNNAPAAAMRSILDLGVPVLITGGGGYELEGTSRAWSRYWALNCGEDPVSLHDAPLEPPCGEVCRRVEAAVERSVGQLKRNLFTMHGIR